MMKKLLTAIFLLLISLIYVIVRFTQSTLYLNKISVKAENPVRIHWNYISIDTGFIKNSPDSIYLIWMTPIYLAVLIALILTCLSIKKKRYE
jgi:hypothetical protein